MLRNNKQNILQKASNLLPTSSTENANPQTKQTNRPSPQRAKQNRISKQRTAPCRFIPAKKRSEATRQTNPIPKAPEIKHRHARTLHKSKSIRTNNRHKNPTKQNRNRQIQTTTRCHLCLPYHQRAGTERKMETSRIKI